ncbi:MAG: L-lysine 6-transaminase [Candidatus Kapabacteria bacterium]|jgi:L-lysine 6-transaminase|nr:L-lysine 6-transaminase [Candidatus Kapabacteria bacterium]
MSTSYKPKYQVSSTDLHEELKKYMLVDGYDFVLDLENSKGSFCIDQRNGKKYTDFFTSFASMPIGMNHPKMTNPEFKAYLGETALNKPSNSDIYTEAMASFVKTFFKVAVPKEFKYSFYVSGGALAVENALKTAFDWKVRKNIAKGLKEEKGHQIIHFKDAFHGRTGYTMSLTNTDPTKVKYFPKFDWPRVTNPTITYPLNEENLKKVVALEEQSISEIKQAFADNPDDIAAIIIEPIQGEGGDNHFRTKFMQALRQICDENEALLIFDEVQSGVGITGKWWAYQHYGVIPDILSFGKKMQVCGILATDRIDDVANNVFHTSSRINSTWGGNLVDMVRSTRYLEIIEEENMVENAANMGKVLISRLEEMEKEFPKLVSAVRGKGLFCAFNMSDADVRTDLINKCYESGLLILSCGKTAVRFRPPLNINDKDLNNGLDIVVDVLKTL